MSEDVQEAAQAPDESIAQWAAFAHLEAVETAVQSMLPLPWSMHPDPGREGLYYISGPPETDVIMEGLTYDNARTLLYLVSNIPQAIEYFRDLAKLWDVLADSALTGSGDLKTYFDVVAKYQMEIAQLEGNPAPIPEVAKAGDLTYMHVGHFVQIPTMGGDANYSPLVSVRHLEGGFVAIELGGMRNTLIYLPEDMALSVAVIDSSPWLDGKSQVQEAPTEEGVAPSL